MVSQLKDLDQQVQDARHQADYNNEKTWTYTEVAAKLGDARTRTN